MQRNDSRGDYPLRGDEQAQSSRTADGAIETEAVNDPLRNDLNRTLRREAALRKILEPCTGGDGTTVVHKTTAVGRTEYSIPTSPLWLERQLQDVREAYSRSIWGTVTMSSIATPWPKPYRGDVRFIRPRAEDTESITQLIKDHMYYSAPLAVADVSAMLNNADAWVAEDSGRIVGVSILTHRSSTVHVLDILVVAPAYRGIGIGSELLVSSLQDIKGSGTVVAECWVHPKKLDHEKTSDELLAARGFVEVSHDTKRWASACAPDYCEHREGSACVCSCKVMVKHIGEPLHIRRLS